MRKTNLLAMLGAACWLAATTTAAAAATPVHAVKQPEYAKSGQAAVLAAKQRYSAEVVDYAYEGWNPAGSGQVEYRFRLWLRKDEREFGVRVAVKVSAASGEPTGMTWTEITR